MADTPENKNAEADLGSKEQEIYDQRLEKARKWRDSGFNPYGNGYRPQHLAAEIHARHGNQSMEEIEKAEPASYDVAGRIVAVRSFGKAAFVKLRDRSGEIQVHLKKDALGDAYEVFKLCDMGDFIAAQGTIFRSKTGELTLSAQKFVPLTKSLRPLPEKWHGLTDVEIRYRQRYLDLVSNPDVKQVFLKRNKLVRFIRDFLDGARLRRGGDPDDAPAGVRRGGPPVHHPPQRAGHRSVHADRAGAVPQAPGGRRHRARLRDQPQLPQRGHRHPAQPRVHDARVLPGLRDYEDLMDITEEMLSGAAKAVTGDTKVSYQGHVLDFGKGWKRIPMTEAIREVVPGLSDKDMADTERLRHELLKTTHAEAERRAIETMHHGELVGALFEHHVEHTLVHPTFITHYPTAVSPLARRNDQNPDITDRFELFVAGREIGNAFSELNDPIDQKGRFLAQLDAKQRGQQETMDYDEDYIRALEHGMPPTAGEGIGIDRVAMLFTDAPSIRDVILFPLLKPLAK